MGTNFYAKHIPTAEEYQDMQEALTNKQLDKLQELLTSATVRYHIGKRSYGWAFNFQAKEIHRGHWDDDEAQVPWDDNLESLKEYLNRPDVQIIDEYDREFTCEQFWNEEVGDRLKVVPGKYNSHETWNDYHPDELIRDDPYEKVKDGIRWTYCWFA